MHVHALQHRAQEAGLLTEKGTKVASRGRNAYAMPLRGNARGDV
jgi:hypothetical protein